MKKMLRSIAVTLVAVLLVTGLVACGGGGEAIDSSKVQLYISNYDGGVGHTWLDAVEERFEAAYAETEFSNGKVGVQIMTRNHKNPGVLGTIAAADEEIFFMQSVDDYYGMSSNFVDISDMVTEWTLPGESGTVESKLSAETQAMLTAGGTKAYYALPHYQSTAGISYNVKLFEDKGFYFADDSVPFEDTRDGFILRGSNQKRTCGPDGIYNTSDDGLPSSIEEFSKLCDFMVDSAVTPFIAYGKNKSYATFLLHALWANLSGYEGTLANVTFKGENIELIKSFNGDEPVVTTANITVENGYDITYQASKYYALEFASKIFTSSAYYDSRGLGTTVSNTDAQKAFLISEYTEDKPIAMMLEGTYWENESRDIGNLERLEREAGDDYENVKYAVMPLPVQAKGRVQEGQGKPQTAIDILNCYGFINKNAVGNDQEKIKLCKEFLQFCYTDISLQEFTLKTGVTKNVNYDLTDAQKNELTYFQKSVWNLKQNGNKIVQLASGDTMYYRNSSSLSPATIWSTSASSAGVPILVLRNGVSAKDYFLGMNNDANSDWWKALAK